MRPIIVLLTILSTFAAKAPAQSLSDVIASLNDRRRVLVQRNQVSVQLDNGYNNRNNALPADSPIDWIGLGTNPSDAAVNGLGIDGRIALLNQAVAEFDRLAPAYANMSPAELAGAGQAGSIAFYRAGDFAPLPRATPGNFQEIVRLLAQRVRALRVLLWPSAFESAWFSANSHAWEDLHYDTHNHPYKVFHQEGAAFPTWKPEQIGAANLSVDEGSPYYSIGFIGYASVNVSGDYSESSSPVGPLRDQSLSFSGYITKRAAIQTTVQGTEEPQISGTVTILSRSRWNQLSVTGAPSEFDPGNGSFLIEGSGGSGDVALLAAPPDTDIGGAWVTTESQSYQGGSYLEKRFVESGYQLKAASLLDQSAPGYSNAYNHSYESNWAIGCRFFSLFLPDFNHGVDAATARDKLDSANRLLADNSSDGAMRLHPRPNLLFGVGIGPGLNGAGDGMLTAGTMADAIENGPSYYGSTGWTYGQVGSDCVLVNRFDSSYALRFAGSVADYHVVYENNRLARTQSLPQLDWSYTDLWHGPSHDKRTLYEAWDSPRLRQVVGRDLIADVTYNDSHFGGYTVTVFRRPMNAGNPVAGQPFDTSNLSPVRTWTFSTPEAGTTAYPTVPEKLQAVGAGNEKYEISAIHTLPNNGAGWAGWYDYAYGFWGGGWTTAWWWYLPGDYEWDLKLSEGETEKSSAKIAIDTTDLSYYNFFSTTAVSSFLDGQPVGVLTSDSLDPFSDATPSDWQYVAAGKTIMGAPTPGDAGDRASRYGKLPTALSIDYDGTQADADVCWDAQGLMAETSQGPWTATGSVDAGVYKVTQKLNNDTIGTEWVESTGPATLKFYSAPDGAHGSKGDSAVAWTEVQAGDLNTGNPGLPYKMKRSDGTGITFGWTIGTGGTGTLITSDGLMPAQAVTRGSATTVEFNARGYPTSSVTKDIPSDLEVAGSTAIDFTDWGAPLSVGDNLTGQIAYWSYDNDLSRISSVTSSLGLTTEYSGFDILGRPTSVTANNITASHTFTGTGVTTDYAGIDILAGTHSSITRDALGRLTESDTTWNGVVDNLGLTYNTGTLGISHAAGPYGTHTADVKQNDGSVSSASGPTLAFGGTTGDALWVSNGLLVSKTEIADAQGTWQQTHTDAWGRVRKIVTPSKSGAGSATTTIVYSDPDSTLRRAITIEPSGRVFIAESDPCGGNGAISRSGIDRDFDGLHPENASLGATDRYTESLTKVEGTKLVTTLKVTENTGLREILKTEWTPTTGVAVTTVNGGEETITSTPDYTDKSVTTTSTKGWTRTTTVNNLGLPTGSSLSGTGIPTTGFDPIWRADGSLASVELTIAGESTNATFNPDGTLASLVVPHKGEILGSHTIADGSETLTADGVTVVRKLDGTQVATSGTDIIGKTDTLAVSGDGYRETIHPTVGSDTSTDFGAAGAPTGKNYAAGPTTSYGYEDELPKTVTVARGGALEFGYSQDSAKDLTSVAWPGVSSGPFTIPPVTQSYGYDRAGRVEAIGDASGARNVVYQNGRPWQTTWSSGLLAGYAVVKNYDSGRETGFTLYRGGTPIHSVTRVPNGLSDEVLQVTSGGITVVPGRDQASQITGFQWWLATNTAAPSLTQTWERGSAGRIVTAGSDVTGAPSFNYRGTANNEAAALDANGRRLKCATAGGEWTYQYTAGQLTSAIHTTLGTFTYHFDRIGRRTDMGAANASDVLNRTLAWTNSQNKTLKITADPTARVWVGINGGGDSEISNFTGSADFTITTTDPNGGWVPWHTLAVLEGRGEGTFGANTFYTPLANPDAKAERSGAVWVPPVSESFAVDADGNRQSTALWDFGWDGRNKLVRARTKNYKNSTTPQGYDITCDYDTEGRRFKKNIDVYQYGILVSQNRITFVWDGWDLIYERHQLPSGLTTLERKYVWGPDISGSHDGAGGAGGLLLIRETRGTKTADYYPLCDGSGHVVALATMIEGIATLVAEYAYGPFGELIYAKGPMAQINPIRYATKYYDVETGLYYWGLRYYDPITAQWTSRELLGENVSLNLYAYCHNDPVNRVDRLGLDEVIVTNGIAYYHFVDEVNGPRGGWLKKLSDHVFLAKFDGSERKFNGKVALGSVSGDNVSLPGGFSIPLSDLQTMADARSMGRLDQAERMRLLTNDLNGWISKNEGAGTSKLVGTLDKIISSPFQAVAGPDALTILGGVADKHDGFSFGVDLNSRNYSRGLHIGTEIDDGIQIATIPLLFNPKNVGTFAKGSRLLSYGFDAARVEEIGSVMKTASKFRWETAAPKLRNQVARINAKYGALYCERYEKVPIIVQKGELGIGTTAGFSPATGSLYFTEEINPLVAFEEYWHAHQIWREDLVGLTTGEIGAARIDGFEIEIEDLINWMGFELK